MSKKSLRHIETIRLVETGQFDVLNSDHLLGLQGMIDCGSVWSMSPYWKRFVKTMIRIEVVKIQAAR